MVVHGQGNIADDGTLVLDQEVDRAGKAAKRREWTIRPVGGGRYAGALSDAAGPVSAETSGNRLHIRFRMKGGLDAEQWISLRPGSRVADNVMAVRKLGITIATLRETIRKTD